MRRKRLIKPSNDLINNSFLYCDSGNIYPPFKKGLYLEEFFVKNIEKYKPQTKRKFIPAFWTNFQIKPWFGSKKQIIQKQLDNWIKDNHSDNGYYTVVQYDDACLLKLPENTLIYGCCDGDIPIPLIYEDTSQKLNNINKLKFNQKNIFCSFVGSITTNKVKPNVRQEMVNFFRNKKKYVINTTSGWTVNIDNQKQQNFVEITKKSKFCFAPRGYGRQSFRFFEIFQLGSIPIYLWNDVKWLPFEDVIDYNKICIVLNIKDINKLDDILNNISEDKYNTMLEEYKKIKHFFTLEGMYKKIISENS